MAAPFLATVTVIAAPATPKGSASTVLAMITPLGGGHADQGLPGFTPPADPGYGLDPGGHPSHGLPWDPARPDNGVPVPPTMWPPGGAVPPLPPDLENQVIVAVHRPGVTEWTVKAYPVPQPK